MKQTSQRLPEVQHALELVGAGRLRLNGTKPVRRPGPHQILARVEATGLCFSDLKLLRQFSDHARKSEVVGGISKEVLAEIPSYVPGDKPTVPGHETVCRIVAVGDKVTRHKPGERCLVQTDYRALRTASSNAAFGYNFEGGLQEYVLMDERVVIDPETDRRYLIPVDDRLSAAALCLVEPWACVEDSYVSIERRTLKAGGRTLVVAEAGHGIVGLAESCSPDGKPVALSAVCADDAQRHVLRSLGVPVSEMRSVEEVPEQAFDDVICFGARRETLDLLNDRLSARGIVNVVTGGRKLSGPVAVGIGRMHYGACRWVGTMTDSAADSYRVIPSTGEIRPGEKIMVLGAGGPMGQMHVIRLICSGVPGISVVAADLEESRLESLRAKTQGLAAARGVPLRILHPQEEPSQESFSYFVLTAPVPSLAADAVKRSLDGALINIFAGIPAHTKQELDLDTYITRQCFLFGTSGSVIRDMEIVLEKIERGRLDTSRSVDAVSGMAGCVEGLAAVEQRTVAGKIIVYPQLHELGLVRLSEMGRRLPSVARKLESGRWSKAAEEELLAVTARKGS